MQETTASTPEKIVVEGHLSGFEPAEVFAYWTEPDKLVQWWPQVAVLDPRVGGSYAFSWPEMDWHLRGTYTAFEPPSHLGFTWKWDHDKPTFGPLHVDLHFDPHPEGGTRMTIEHGPFGPGDEGERQGITEGWIHFGMRLAGLRVSSG